MGPDPSLIFCPLLERNEAMNTKLATILLLASATALAACAKKAPDVLPPPPATETVPATQPTPQVQPTGPMAGTQAHFAAAVGSSTTVYFDTDRHNIDSQDAAALQAQAQYFARYPQITFTIEGHADERGTREYNLALGARRAAATRQYLSTRGIQADRIRTISFGKERPVAVCDDISCWSQNRRAVTVLGGAGS
jgi:peptidoglycan-associated lipoprotein